MNKNKVLKIKFYSNEGEWDFATREEIHGITNKGTKIYYHVSDLSDCPEDAILGRGLFSAGEYLETILLGMRLAQEGYTDIEIEECKFDEDDE